jgi:hypothetical protein
LVAIYPGECCLRGLGLFDYSLYRHWRRDIIRLLKSLNNRRTGHHDSLRRLDFLRPESNFIKLAPIRVADDKDIPRMDYIAQGLEDIKASKVQTVVVYKVDRLTRSLSDFAKIVDVLDAHNT